MRARAARTVGSAAAVLVLLVIAGAAVAVAQPAPDDAGVGQADGGPLRYDGPLIDVPRPQASASASPSELQLGETLTLFVEVVFDESVTVNLPSTLDLAPAFDELRRTSSDEVRRDGTRKRVYQLELRAWELGDLAVPPIQVGYSSPGGGRSWVVTNAVPLRVLGLLGNVDDKTALIGETPPVPLRRRDWRLPLAAAVVLAAGLIALVAWRWRKRKPRPVAPAAVLPRRVVKVRLSGAAERALAAIAAIEQDGVLVREPRAGYERLVAVLRTYWHEQFGVGIRDRTSAELVRALGKRGLPEPARAASAAWLERCDLVKYAKEEPGEAESAEALATARELVHASLQPPAVREAAA